MTGPAARERRNVVAFYCGPRDSGKSKLLRDTLTSHTPRVLSVDVTGEVLEHNPHAIKAVGLEDVRRALRFAAKRGRQWQIAAFIGEEDFSALLPLLMDDPVTDRAGFSRVVGGLAIECPEVDVIAPNGATSQAYKDALRRGRHSCLSLYQATQRPASCARDCTAQVDYLAAFCTFEPADVAYIGKALGRWSEPIVSELPQYHFLYFVRATARVHWCDDRRRIVKTFDLRGREV